MRQALLPSFSLFLLACGSEVRLVDTGSGGGSSSSESSSSSSSESSSSGSSTSTSSTASSGQGGAGGGSSFVCVPLGGPQMPGPLCGPEGTPCKILINEVIPTEPAFRNDAPAIALNPDCSPWILFSNAYNGYHGFEAKRDGQGSWFVNKTPFDFATVGFFVTSAGYATALPNDGAFGASLWGFSVMDWSTYGNVPANATHIARGFAQGQNGTVHAAFVTDLSEIVLGTFDMSWSMSSLGSGSGAPTLAVSPNGQPHVAWPAAPSAGITLIRWQTPSSYFENVVDCGTPIICGGQPSAMAVTAPDAVNPMGRPHLLYQMKLPTESSELRYTTRDGKDFWAGFDVTTDPPGTTLRPLGIVTSESGEVRLFYSKVNPSLDIGEVYIAWKQGSAIEKQLLLAGTEVIGASFARDGGGNIHIAMYTLAGFGGSVYDVRYIVIGV